MYNFKKLQEIILGIHFSKFVINFKNVYLHERNEKVKIEKKTHKS